jgi:hypothetical protein
VALPGVPAPVGSPHLGGSIEREPVHILDSGPEGGLVVNPNEDLAAGILSGRLIGADNWDVARCRIAPAVFPDCDRPGMLGRHEAAGVPGR